MTPSLGLLVIHGMGNQETDFGDDMIAEINERVADQGADPARLAWEKAYWAPLLSAQENDLWKRFYDKNDLDYAWIRRFVLNSFGDAVAYQRVPGAQTDFYREAHKIIRASLVRLREKLGNTDAPLIVLAHSLGSVMVSNYLWDQQHPVGKKVKGATPFERMKTLAGFITFGCNLAVYSFAHSPYTGFTFPPIDLPDSLKPLALWANYYDPDDVLGWPVKQLCPEYEANPQIADRPINVGGLLTSWNPAAHSEYWTDNDFTDPVAQQIADVLRAV